MRVDDVDHAVKVLQETVPKAPPDLKPDLQRVLGSMLREQNILEGRRRNMHKFNRRRR